MSTGEMDDLEPSVRELVEMVASEADALPDQIRMTLEAALDLSLAEVSDEDGKRLKEAWEGDDVAELETIFREYDVPEATIEQFLEMVADADDGPGGEDSETPPTGVDPDEPGPAPTSNGSAAPSSESVSRAEVQNMVKQEVRESTNELKRFISQQSGGGGGGGGSGEQQQNQLGMMLAQTFLQNQQGPSFGEVLQKQAMNDWVKRMSRPSLGEILEVRMYQQMAERMELPEDAIPDMDDLMGNREDVQKLMQDVMDGEDDESDEVDL